MKISKKAINIICIAFEIAFAVVLALEIYSIVEAINESIRLRYQYTTTALYRFAVEIILPGILLIATIVIHILAMKPVRTPEQISAKKQERKQRQIEQLQAELDELRKDGD